MTVPNIDIAGCREAHRRLLATIEHLTDEQARAPSLLPEWTIGHVLTHVARNADSVVRRLDGAMRGEIVDQYVGGYEGRAADIAAGAGRPAAALIDDIRTTNEALERSIAAMPDDAWDNLTGAVGGREQPANQMVFARWREVEVHHVDLGFAYTVADWPDTLVDRWLPELLARLPARADRQQLMGWTIGRAPVPELGPWS